MIATAVAFFSIMKYGKEDTSVGILFFIIPAYVDYVAWVSIAKIFGACL